MALNLRNLPEDLHKRLKVKAAASGLTLEDYATQALERSLADPIDPGTQDVQVRCPLCGLEGPLVMMGENARCWHCGAGFVPPEGVQ